MVKFQNSSMMTHNINSFILLKVDRSHLRKSFVIRIKLKIFMRFMQEGEDGAKGEVDHYLLFARQCCFLWRYW